MTSPSHSLLSKPFGYRREREALRTRTRFVIVAKSFVSIAHLHQTFGSAVVALNTEGSRILVGDMQESVYFAVYKAPENRLLPFRLAWVRRARAQTARRR